jgi:DNA-binding transcriptional ArsR family regulator
VEALIARRRLGALAIEKGIKGAAFMVWSFLLDSTICWQRTEERHFQSFVATQTGLSKRAVSVAVIALRDAGLIDYEAGRASQTEGRNVPSRFIILNVGAVLDEGVSHQHVTPVSHEEGVPPRDVTPLSHEDVPPSHTGVGHPATQACDTVSHRDVTYRGGRTLRRKN